MIWNADTDEISVLKQNKMVSNVVTKRFILKTIASVYEPLGLLSPIMVKPKLLLQELWKRKINWDIEVPSDIM